jgi:hypothetical protein
MFDQKMQIELPVDHRLTMMLVVHYLILLPKTMLPIYGIVRSIRQNI